MQKTWVGSLSWEDPLEEDVETHSSIFAWSIPMERGVWRAAFLASQRVGRDWASKHIRECTVCVTVVITIKMSFEDNLYPEQIQEQMGNMCWPQKLQADRILEDVVEAATVLAKNG